MIYVFDTSAFIWLFENAQRCARWMKRIPEGSVIYYHPVTAAEIAAQTHEEYLARRHAPDRVGRIAENRRALLVALANPAARPPWFRYKIREFPTSRRAAKHVHPTVYDQLKHDKTLRRHLYRTMSNDVVVLATMVDHIILAVATFLHEDGAGLAGFVTRDRQLHEAAERCSVPVLYAGLEPHRPTGGSWLG